MSDRLPSRRRRTSGGRHVAPRPQPTVLPRAARATKVPTRIAQGGVALGLVLSMGAVVVTADAQEPATTATPTSQAPLARAAARGASNAYLAQLRQQAVAAAQTVVEEASRVRSDATQVAVPEDALAELDAATAALQDAMEDVETSSFPERSRNVSRGAERTGESTDESAQATDGSGDATAADAAGDQADQPVAAAEPDTDSAGTASMTVDPAAPGVETQDSELPPGERLAEVTLPDAPDPATTPLREALDRVKQAAESVLATTEQKKAEAAAAQAAAEEAARVAAEQEAQRAAWKASLQGYSNGQIPSSALCGVSFASSALLRCDAAEALEQLDAAFFAHFGTHLHVSDSYRSYSAQVACRANKGRLCAAPGTSNHGMGVAVDLGGSVQSFGTAQHEWMRQHAPAYQWTLPEWARQGGSKPEPWHWEYVG